MVEKAHLCRLCGSPLPAKADIVFPSVAVHNNLLSEEQLFKPVWRESVALYTCPKCALVQQATAIPPDKLYADGVNYVGEWRFQPHLEAQLNLLKQTSGYRERSCIEVGCNAGGFLAELRRRGWIRTCGIEANGVAAKSARARGISVYNSLFTRDICRNIVAEQGRFSLFVARHTLEHIADLTNFFDLINILLEDDGLIFLEVPNFEPSHTPLPWSFTFINHEHCSYFTKESLANCVNNFSYRVLFMEQNAMCGGVLNCLAVKVDKEISNAFDIRHTPLNVKELEDYVNGLRQDVQVAKTRGAHVLLYGAGCHGISFLNISGLQPSIEFILDDVPAKQGLYVPGCNAKIVPPSQLASLNGEIFILLAIHPEFEEESVKKIRKYSRGNAEIHFLLSRRPTCRL